VSDSISKQVFVKSSVSLIVLAVLGLAGWIFSLWPIIWRATCSAPVRVWVIGIIIICGGGTYWLFTGRRPQPLHQENESDLDQPEPAPAPSGIDQPAEYQPAGISKRLLLLYRRLDRECVFDDEVPFELSCSQLEVSVAFTELSNAGFLRISVARDGACGYTLTSRGTRFVVNMPNE